MDILAPEGHFGPVNIATTLTHPHAGTLQGGGHHLGTLRTPRSFGEMGILVIEGIFWPYMGILVWE